YRYNQDKAAGFVRELIRSPRGFAFVGERGNELVAMFLAAPHEHWACDFLVATEYVMYVHPTARGTSLAARLVAEFVTWARAVGANLAVAGSTTGVNEDLTARLYERRGFTRIGTTLELELWASGHR